MSGPYRTPETPGLHQHRWVRQWRLVSSCDGEEYLACECGERAGLIEEARVGILPAPLVGGVVGFAFVAVPFVLAALVALVMH